MPLTLAQMHTLISDGGANTAADMRDVITAIVHGQRAPYSVDAPEDVWWEGDIGDFTHIDPTGTSVRTEKDGFLSVRFSGQGSGDVGCLLKPHTFTIGDRFATHIRSLGKDHDTHTMVFFSLTDGVVASSQIVTAMIYQDFDRVSAWWGTITTLNNTEWIRHTVFDWPLAGIHIAIEYVAADTFQIYLSPDGVSWSDFGAVDIADGALTMTPTHFGVGWSAFGGSTEGLASFGPICKIG